ncbi:MAG: carbamate kinase [candidate division KSB1 bacterium]|nr:carbamate kinase [candidate division KSB1 bacterium]MDZ7319086.1 carbamate kinase [candidate division KSB1 bacterium]MDZ7340768.1 carbamate kinase [candidate division KSB1 bacterium]
MKEKPRTAVIALGGNAITREFEEGNIHQQFANTRRSLVGPAELISRGYHLAITHGNGPQVGNALIRVEESRHLVPPIPLGVIVADLEGGMGYMIAQSLQNKLHLRGIKREVVTVVAQVIVDRNDQSILNPTKFVGPFYHEHEIEALARTRNWVIKYDEGRGWRRVVPSPIPLGIVEKDVIKKLVDQGVVVITVGGGGAPVYVEDDGTYEGVDGVVDKDLSAAILARDIGAQELYILTAVDRVALNYRKPNQVDLDELTIEQAKRYLTEGQFPKGSMGPKIEAAIQFIENGGEVCIITSTERMIDAIHGMTGTRIVKG